MRRLRVLVDLADPIPHVTAWPWHGNRPRGSWRGVWWGQTSRPSPSADAERRVASRTPRTAQVQVAAARLAILRSDEAPTLTPHSRLNWRLIGAAA